MNRVFGLIVLIACAIVIAASQTTNAALVQMDSADFSWKYEMDAAPTTQDIAPTTGLDWDYYTNASGTWAGPDAAFDGTVNGDGTITTLDSQYQLESDVGTARHVWNNVTYATGYTVEVRLRVPEVHGEGGALGILTGQSVDPSAGCIVVAKDGLHWSVSQGYTDTWTLLDDNSNSDGMHVFRIAQLPGQGAFNVWRDGVRVGDSLPAIITPPPGNIGLHTPYLDLGSITALNWGATQYDYIRITSGAYAPMGEIVPEPSSCILLASSLLGLLCYAWRKREQP